MTNDSAVQAQLNSRLQSLGAQQPTQRSATKMATAGPARGYGLFSLLLVAILAFLIGHYSQHAMPEIMEFVNQMKAKYIK